MSSTEPTKTEAPKPLSLDAASTIGHFEERARELRAVINANKLETLRLEGQLRETTYWLEVIKASTDPAKAAKEHGESQTAAGEFKSQTSGEAKSETERLGASE